MAVPRGCVPRGRAPRGASGRDRGAGAQLPQGGWQLAVAGGTRVKVLRIHEDGWAEVRDASGTTGLVPACYLDLPPPAPAK